MAIVARKNSTVQLDTDQYFRSWCARVKSILCTGTDVVVDGTGTNGYSPIYGHGWAESEAAGITELVFRRLRGQKTRDGRQLSVFGAARSLNLKADWTNRVIDNLLTRGCKIVGYEEAVETALDDMWFSDKPVTAQNAAIALIEDETLFVPSKSQALPGNNVDGTRLDDAPKSVAPAPMTQAEKTSKEYEAEATEILRQADPKRHARSQFYTKLGGLQAELASAKFDQIDDAAHRVLELISMGEDEGIITCDTANKLCVEFDEFVENLKNETVLDTI